MSTAVGSAPWETSAEASKPEAAASKKASVAAKETTTQAPPQTGSSSPTKNSNKNTQDAAPASDENAAIKTPSKATTRSSADATANTAATAPSTAPSASGNPEDMFSPTSAAALALSTLVHGPNANRRQTEVELSRTRLFASSSNGKKASLRNQQAQDDVAAGAAAAFQDAAAAAAAAAGMNGFYAHHQMQMAAAAAASGEGGQHPMMGGPWMPHLGFPYGSSPAGHANLQEIVQGRPSPTGQAGAAGAAAAWGHHPHPGMPFPHQYMQHAHGPYHPAFGQLLHPDNPAASMNAKRVAEGLQSLVSPTPAKKTKLDGSGGVDMNSDEYNRKKKSLGVLAENFMTRYKDAPPGTTIVLDEAALEFDVERRRIYDVVNILESICLLVKKAKNTYTWLGKSNLDQIFGQLQAEAINEYPKDAKRFGLQKPGTTDAGTTNQTLVEVSRRPSKARENRSLARLSQEFLQLYLIGHTNLSLPEASDLIQGEASVEELVTKGQGVYGQHDPLPETAKDIKTAAKRGMKTKIRRLYDIANVFKSVGLLHKIEVENPGRDRRPRFSWAYPLTNKEIQSVYNNHLHKKIQNGTYGAQLANGQAFRSAMRQVSMEPEPRGRPSKKRPLAPAPTSTTTTTRTSPRGEAPGEAPAVESSSVSV